MERNVYTASVGVDPLWRVNHFVVPGRAVEVEKQTMIRRPDGSLRSLYHGERVFDSREEALAWVADEVERHAAEIAAEAAAIRREIEVPV